MNQQTSTSGLGASISNPSALGSSSYDNYNIRKIRTIGDSISPAMTFETKFLFKNIQKDSRYK